MIYPTSRSQFFAWLVKTIHKAELMYVQPSTSAQVYTILNTCSLDSQKQVRYVRLGVQNAKF